VSRLSSDDAFEPGPRLVEVAGFFRTLAEQLDQLRRETQTPVRRRVGSRHVGTDLHEVAYLFCGGEGRTRRHGEADPVGADQLVGETAQGTEWVEGGIAAGDRQPPVEDEVAVE